jgi:hypothetical protein
LTKNNAGDLFLVLRCYLPGIKIAAHVMDPIIGLKIFNELLILLSSYCFPQSSLITQCITAPCFLFIASCFRINIVLKKTGGRF